MHPIVWIPRDVRNLIDIGCNAGDLLRDIAKARPHAQLVGVDVNAGAIATARAAVPSARIEQRPGYELPCESASMDYATIIEVIEHIPAAKRRATLEEIHRVLAPGKTLLLRCPHAGWFDWLDSNNLRFRFPRLYGKLVGRGMRDKGYAGGSDDVVWHHHFTETELNELISGLFRIKNRAFGGLFIFPIVDILRWPFYRKKMLGHPALNALEEIANWDMGFDFGRASFTILLELEKI
jgi:SAM-dependent methyltransferase